LHNAKYKEPFRIKKMRSGEEIEEWLKKPAFPPKANDALSQVVNDFGGSDPQKVLDDFSGSNPQNVIDDFDHLPNQKGGGCPRPSIALRLKIGDRLH